MYSIDEAKGGGGTRNYYEETTRQCLVNADRNKKNKTRKNLITALLFARSLARFLLLFASQNPVSESEMDIHLKLAQVLEPSSPSSSQEPIHTRREWGERDENDGKGEEEKEERSRRRRLKDGS